MVVKNGTKVKVVNNGCTFDLFSAWHGLSKYKGDFNFISGDIPKNGNVYTIVYGGLKYENDNQWYHEVLYLIKDEDTNQVYIIGSDGIEETNQ